jgi:aspartate aminotransferase-like enzyme
MISLTPGPTHMPDFIREVLQKPIIYHRSAEFKELYAQTCHWLKKVFLATEEYKTLFVTGSGTNAMEMLLSNLNPHKKLLITDFGKFSGRWAEIAKAYNLNSKVLSYQWGDYPKINEILQAIEQDKDIEVLCLTHSETSTATRTDVEQIAFYAKKIRPDILILVDGITSVGAIPLYIHAWGLDAVITSSQKALGCPPGMSFIVLSPEYIEKSQPCGYAYNLQKYLDNDAKQLTPFTPATQILMTVNSSLEYFIQTGLPIIWNHTHTLAQYTRQKIQEMGLKLCSTNPSDSITAFYLPEKITAGEVVQKVYHETGILLGKGQAEWKEKIIRIAHTAYIKQEYLQTAMESIRKQISPFI